MENEELKNCPCCGSDNIVFKTPIVDPTYGGPKHEVYLIKCKARGCGITTGQHKKKETVIDIWNRREHE